MKQINKIFFVLIAILLSGVMEMAAQTRKVVSGTVTELLGTSAEPLVGVNVNIVYNVTIPEGETNLTIVFSYIGMQTKRIKYTGQTLLNVRMDSDTKSIDQVEVTARRIERNDMGITNKEMVSATQKVKMDDLVATAPVVSVEDALQGQLGGVDIVLGGGDPGTRSAIRIRGTSTLNASSDP